VESCVGTLSSKKRMECRRKIVFLSVFKFLVPGGGWGGGYVKRFVSGVRPCVRPECVLASVK
jgi:hypothetical protein